MQENSKRKNAARRSPHRQKPLVVEFQGEEHSLPAIFSIHPSTRPRLGGRALVVHPEKNIVLACGYVSRVNQVTITWRDSNLGGQ